MRSAASDSAPPLVSADFRSNQEQVDSHVAYVAAETNHPDAILTARPTPGSRPGPRSRNDQPRGDAPIWPVVAGTNHPDMASCPPKPNVAASCPGSGFLTDHVSGDTHGAPVGEGSISRSGQQENGTHALVAAAGHTTPGEATRGATPTAPLPRPGVLIADPILAFLADILDDLEQSRQDNANRLRIFTTPADQPDKDGIARGRGKLGITFGMREDEDAVAMLRETIATLHAQEKRVVKTLERMIAANPLSEWIASQTGIGPKGIGRLLAAIGDPAWNRLHDRPRTVSELWAYCGLHVVDGVAPQRSKGQRANWSDTAKMRAYLIAESAYRNRQSPYRTVYDSGRERYAEAVHVEPCKPCGKGKGKANVPAPAGSPLSDGHQHARALRLVAKAVLRDLWRESRRLHGWDVDEPAAA